MGDHRLKLQTAGAHRRERCRSRATVERLFGHLSLRRQPAIPASTDKLETRGLKQPLNCNCGLFGSDSTDRLGTRGLKQPDCRNQGSLYKKSMRQPPYRVGMVETVHLSCRVNNKPVDSPLWCCSVIDGYSRLLTAACFTPQPRSHATMLQLLNQLLAESIWIPDVLFFLGDVNYPMVRIRKRLHASGALKINGIAFLTNPIATSDESRSVDVLHSPLDSSFAYVLIEDRWILALPEKRNIASIVERLGSQFPM
jgi:hypothetical protein